MLISIINKKWDKHRYFPLVALGDNLDQAREKMDCAVEEQKYIKTYDFTENFNGRNPEKIRTVLDGKA